MRRQQIDVRVEANASPAQVWAVLSDRSRWPDWSPLEDFALERPAAGGGDGVGAVARFRKGRTTSHEELVELVPERRLSYVLLSGLPLEGYRADVDLAPSAGGTTIRWRSSFTPARRGTGWVYRLALGAFIRRMARALARRAAAPVAVADTAGATS